MQEKAPKDRDLALIKERYETLLNATEDWVWEVNPDGLVTYSSSNVFAITGYSPGELQDKNLSSVFTSRGGEKSLERHIAEVCRTQQPFKKIQISVSHKDGRELILETTGLPVFDEHGVMTGIRGISRNMTHQQWAEEALRKSEDRYRSFIESAPIGMMISDTEGHIIYANQKLMEITGYNVAEWKGRSYIEMVYPEDYGAILESRARALNTLGPVKPFEIRIYHANGEIVWLRLIPHSVYETDEKGNKVVAYFQNFIEDITATKKAREEKQKLEQQLSQSHKMEALGTLAGGVAHDFNNILYPIIGYTEMTLSEVAENQFASENLQEVLLAAKRAQKLVNQILAFSRRGEEKLLPMRIQPVLENVLRMVRPSLPSNVTVKKEIQKSGGVVMADQTQIHQVVMNLCTNAYQSMGKDGGVLGITLDQCSIGQSDSAEYPQLSPGNYVRLVVSDSGAGMDEATRNRIFEPYFTTKPPDRGSGMGLAVVHGIVTKYNGVIKVESEPDKGSTFTVLLPLVSKSPSDTPDSEPAPLPKGNESILLVGGEKSLRDISAKMLSRLGYTVVTAGSGKGALRYLRSKSRSFDLVLANFKLSDMDGEALAEEVRYIQPGLPTVLLYKRADDISEENKGGFQPSTLLVKTLDIKKIALGIRDILDDSA